MKKLILSLLVAITVNLLFAFPNSQLMNSKAGSISKQLSDSVFSDPKTNLPELVKSLTNGAGEPSMRARIIHDWICNNISYDTDLYFSGKVSKQDYISVLKKKKGVCSGYSSVFVEMCRLAGVEAKRIQGYSKGFGYTGKLGPEPDHEWNAVKIGNFWKLVDCCWDAGYVERKTFIKHYSAEWFFLSPEKMLYSHLPEKEEDQLVKEDKIKTKEQFVKEPYIQGRFFTYGFELTEKIPDYTTEISEETTYNFKINGKGVSTNSTLQDKKSKKRYPNELWIDRKGNQYTYFFDVPDTKEYEAIIFAKNNNSENYPDKFSIAEFEGRILPTAQSLVADNAVAGKTISKMDFEQFNNAFFKSQENGYYYYKENQFNSKRINAVKNVFKTLKIESGFLEPVLSFDIKAAEGYAGSGTENKYPHTYSEYNSTVNTKLTSPKSATLKAGETVQFELDSKDFLGIAVHFGKKSNSYD